MPIELADKKNVLHRINFSPTTVQIILQQGFNGFYYAQ